MDQVQDTVYAFINAQTWVESHCIACEHLDHLMGSEADAIFELVLASNKDNLDVVELLVHRRILLAQIACDGIEATYRRLITPEYVASLEQEMMTLPPKDERQIDVLRALLELTDRSNRSQLAELKQKLGISLSLTDNANNLLEAIDIFKEAIGSGTIDKDSRLWGVLNLSLADSIVRLSGTAVGSGDAIEYFENALPFWKKEDPKVAQTIKNHIATLLKQAE